MGIFKQNDLVSALINKMLEPHGVDYDHVLNNPTIDGVDWFMYYTWTSEQSENFARWASKEIKKSLRCSMDRAESEYGWFNLMWGLKIDDDKNS